MLDYIRRGECNHCGWCCQFEGIERRVLEPPAGKRTLDSDEQRFYQLRGGRVDVVFQRVRFVSYSYLPCSEHDVVAKRCRNYADRPEICQAFPARPEQIESTLCSYWFEATLQDGTVERRGGQGSPYPTQARFDR